MDAPPFRLDHAFLEAEDGFPMGDKSPKAKERAKKQDSVNKDHKKAAAAAKVAQQGAASSGKKGR
ncbi:MAG TPA: hypothetical protein VNN72_04355 [Polyangiaceae bacterium]|nr:hypothetical protein [Polyangiaceae bacterium]